MKFDDSTAGVVVNSANGIYIAQTFAERYLDNLRELAAQNKISNEDIDSLINGPDDEHYIEAYSNLFPIRMKDLQGKEYVFAQVGDDSDIWEIPAQEYDIMEWDEM